MKHETVSQNSLVQTAKLLAFIRQVSVAEVSERIQAVLTEGLRDFIYFLRQIPEKNLQLGHDRFHDVSSSSSSNYSRTVPYISLVSDRPLKHISNQ